MAAKTNSHFKKGSGAYECIDCGKLTRETGGGESSVEMCSDCYELASGENYASDEELEMPSREEFLTALHAGKHCTQIIDEYNSR